MARGHCLARPFGAMRWVFAASLFQAVSNRVETVNQLIQRRIRGAASLLHRFGEEPSDNLARTLRVTGNRVEAAPLITSRSRRYLRFELRWGSPQNRETVKQRAISAILSNGWLFQALLKQLETVEQPNLRGRIWPAFTRTVLPRRECRGEGAIPRQGRRRAGLQPA
jgi:hypothetical protein